MMKRVYRPMMTVVVLAVIVTVCGCFKATTGVAVRPDLGVDFSVTMAVPAEFAEDMAEKPGDEMEMDEMKTYTEGDWYYIEGRKSVAGTEELQIPAAAEATFIRSRQEHRLSTRYMVGVELPKMDEAMGQTPAPAQPSPDAESPEDAEAQRQQEEAIGMMMSGMMSGFEYNLEITLPGTITTTSGERIAPDTVRYAFSWKEMSQQEDGKLLVTSRVPNYTRIGRLADQMVGRGAEPLIGLRLVQYVSDGLLPDPPVDMESDKKLSAEDYLKLTQIIEALDAQLQPEVTTGIINEIGLNASDITPAQVALAHTAVEALDLQEMAVEDIQGAMK
ncbi:MAG: hypothetical protein ACLFWB_00020 [Armatimonadota bacterium]